MFITVSVTQLEYLWGSRPLPLRNCLPRAESFISTDGMVAGLNGEEFICPQVSLIRASPTLVYDGFCLRCVVKFHYFNLPRSANPPSTGTGL